MNSKNSIKRFIAGYAGLLLFIGFTFVILYFGVTSWVRSLLMAFAYGGLAWHLSSLMGTCPLRWRRLAIWVAVISITIAWWVELLTLYFFRVEFYFWIDLLFVLLGALVALITKLRLGFVSCSCSIDGWLHEFEDSKPSDGKFHNKKSGDKGFIITDHPLLPQIIASSFGWKRVSVAGFSAICTGRSIVSLPHFSYGSCGDLSLADENRNLLFSSLSSLHFIKGFYGIEWRYPDLITERKNGDLASDGKGTDSGAFEINKVASWLTLSTEKEAVWSGFTSNLRRKINKATQSNFEVVLGGEEYLSAFMKIYRRRMYMLGSAALSPIFFRNLIRQYSSPGRVDVWLLKQDGKVVGGAINLGYGFMYENCWFATVDGARDHYGSYLLQWRMICHAIDLGYSRYSFGRSTFGSGVHQHKLQWGAKDIPLMWVNWPESKGGIRSQRWLAWIWRHVPYSISVFVGKSLAKWIY